MQPCAENSQQLRRIGIFHGPNRQDIQMQFIAQEVSAFRASGGGFLMRRIGRALANYPMGV